MNGHKIKYLFVLVVITLFFSCCSKKHQPSDRVEQRVVFQQYSIRFDHEKAAFLANARFTLNNPTGISIKLTKESKVFFNHHLLKESYHDEGYEYSFQSDSKLPDQFEFQYVNNDCDTFTNKFFMKTFEIENPNFSSWHKNSRVFLTYVGQKFSDDETLFCVLYQNNELVTTIELGLPDRKNFYISADYFSDIPNGKYNCQFIRSFSSSKINGMERGGNFECEYYSKMVPISLMN